MKRTKTGLIVPSDLDTTPTAPAAADVSSMSQSPVERAVETWTEADVRAMGVAQLFFTHRALMAMPVCARCREVLLLAENPDAPGAVASCACTVRHWPEPTAPKKRSLTPVPALPSVSEDDPL